MSTRRQTLDTVTGSSAGAYFELYGAFDGKRKLTLS